MLDLMALSLNTTFFVDDTRLAIFTSLLLDGQQWMTTPTGTWDWSVVGRGNSNPTSLTSGIPPTILRTLPLRTAELHRFADALEHGGSQLLPDPLVGNRHFYDSDYMVHRRKGYMVSVRMYSNRTIAARCVNSQVLSKRRVICYPGCSGRVLCAEGKTAEGWLSAAVLVRREQVLATSALLSNQ
eukprot:m.893973 g.893973  ORF g.893973 m.893973 type:complete len:184 (+) comp23664_c1_seq5:1276-1827(+)